MERNYMKILFSQHAIQQMFKRNISMDRVKQVILYGEVINYYPDDKPYPSKLLLLIENEIPLHVVIAENFNTNEIVVITAYIPEKNIWTNDFKDKR
jgi:hypothetical protein